MRSNNHHCQPSKSTEYDLIVVGGGIYGATLAWEAISRGLSIILLEQNDFGSGTSANSMKTIHGGIRYLQSLDIPKMRQSIRERRILSSIAPHLVSPLSFAMPTYRSFKKGKALVGLGLIFNDLVAFDRNYRLDPSSVFPASELLPLEKLKGIAPGYHDRDATGAARWYDAQVHNSERLVLSFILSARNRGAHVFNYIKCEDYLISKGQVIGVSTKDTLTGEKRSIYGRQIVDCTGPWLEENSLFSQRICPNKDGHYTKAWNLVINRKLTNGSFGFVPKSTSIEGARLLFISPWRDRSIVGTWYGLQSSHNDYTIRRNEINECLNEINSVFPSLHLNLNDITLIHIGRLPVDGFDTDTGQPKLQSQFKIVSAADFGGPGGLYWVQGEKYTTARTAAEATIDLLAPRMHKKVSRSISHRVPLYGGDIDAVAKETERVMDRYADILSPPTRIRLFKNYGRILYPILSYAEKNSSFNKPIPGTEHTVQAEIEFIIDHEMPRMLSDVILRRTDIGSRGVPNDQTIEYCAQRMAKRFDWSKGYKHQNMDALHSYYRDFTVK